MKNFLLAPLIIFCFLSQISAQDFQCFTSIDTLYFQKQLDDLPLVGYVPSLGKSIIVDSITISSGVSTAYLRPSYLYGYLGYNLDSVHPRGSSWLGDKCLMYTNGDQYFVNINGDSLLLVRDQPANSAWPVFTEVSGAYIEGKFTGDSVVLINGSISDTMKVFTYSRFDSNGVFIELLDSLLISRHNGIYSYPSFVYWPGMNNNNFGILENLWGKSYFWGGLRLEIDIEQLPIIDVSERYKQDFVLETISYVISGGVKHQYRRTYDSVLSVTPLTGDSIQITHRVKVWGTAGNLTMDSLIEEIVSDYVDSSETPYIERAQLSLLCDQNFILTSNLGLIRHWAYKENGEFDRIRSQKGSAGFDTTLFEYVIPLGGPTTANYLFHRNIGFEYYIDNSASNIEKRIAYRYPGASYGYIEPVSIQKLDKKELNIYPNPTTNTLYISANHIKANAPYEIFDLLGRNVQSGNLDGDKLSISQIIPGMYVLILRDENQILNATFYKE